MSDLAPAASPTVVAAASARRGESRWWIVARTTFPFVVVALAWEVTAHLGITVNNVAPGFVRSNPTTERQWASYGSEGQARLVDSLFLRRLGSAEDIAAAVLFFASDLAGWITGQILSVDGGRS